MNSGKIASLIVMGLIVVAGASLALTGQKKQEALETYSLADIAVHGSRDDCWTVIEGSVYDLTSFVSSHPGGNEILLACGIDGTSLFKNRETTSGEPVGSGSPHSSSAASQLKNLKIGVLAD